MILTGLAGVVLMTSHALNAHQAESRDEKPLVIQVISLQWKWLFVFPEQGIATVGQIDIPQGRQVEFDVTSVVPASVFSISQLTQQTRITAGMRTRIPVCSEHEGTYQGLNLDHNQARASDMQFSVSVVSPEVFTHWVNRVKSSNSELTLPMYQQLKKPSVAAPVLYFSAVMPTLFQHIMKSTKIPKRVS